MIDIKEFQESVAIIDDEIEISKAINDILTELNYKVFFTTNFQELFDYVSKNQVFLIISDYSMPEKNGIQVCHEIKKIHPLLPFVLFTGYADKEIAINALKEGINDVLEKPQDFKKIPEITEKYAKNRLQYIEKEKNELEILKQIFLDEAQEIMNDLDEYILKLEESNNDAIIDIVFRKIHTLKGSSSAFPKTEDLSKLLHSFETLLSKLKNKEFISERHFIDLILEASDMVKLGLQYFSGKNINFNPSSIIDKLKNYKPQQNQTNTIKEQKIQVLETEDDSIQVSHEKLESFMELSGELIVFKNMLQTFLRDMAHKQDDDHFSHAVEDYNQTLEKISEEFQNQIMNVRKVQLQKAFSKFPRLMRQLSQDMKKDFKYETEGLDLGVDKNIAKALSSSLIHLLRNAADHGMDTHEERIQKGKNPHGTIKLSCFQKGDVVHTIIEDDGRGIHKEKIISKAKEKNLVLESALSQMTDEEIYELIFLPGFSTAEQISNVSGRGVGMDVVKTEIARLNGNIQIKSEVHKGTQFIIQIPIPKTVIVENSIMALSNNVTLAIPLTSIDSITSAKELNLQHIQNIETCQYKERTIRIGHYYEYLKNIGIKVEHKESSTDTIVILQHKDELVGLKLDKIIGQQEAVIRSFDPIIENIPGFKGTSLLDNEKIAYVVDAEKIIEISKNIQDQGE